MAYHYVPSSYCVGALSNEFSQLRVDSPATAVAVSEPATPATVDEVDDVAVSVAGPRQPLELEPIESSYAQGAFLPASYSMPYSSAPPTPRKLAAPPKPLPAPKQQPSQNVASEEPTLQVANGGTNFSRVQFTPAAARIYEPSSYAFGQLNDCYAEAIHRAAPPPPPPPQPSSAEPIAETQKAATPCTAVTVTQTSRMDSTQLPSARAAPTVKVFVSCFGAARTQFHDAPATPQPRATQRSAKLRPEFSTYVGGVPNDLVAAYENAMPAYHQEYSYLANAGPSEYHFMRGQREAASPVESAVTAEIQEEEANVRAATLSLGSQYPAYPGSGTNVAGRAFAPLNEMPCSEYQFDQLQDLAACT